MSYLVINTKYTLLNIDADKSCHFFKDNIRPVYNVEGTAGLCKPFSCECRPTKI